MSLAAGGEPSGRRKSARALTAASRLASAGKREQALRKLDEVFRLDAANIVAHRLYQDLMVAAGRRREMLERYARAKTNRKNRRLKNLVHYMEARAQIDPQVRRGRLESIFNSNPRHFWAAYDLVAACVAAGDLQAAEKYARAARALRSRDADVCNVLGNVLFQAGKLEDAEREFREALRLRDGFAEALYNLGLVRAAQKRYAEAAGLFAKAGEARRDFAEAHNNRGHALARLGKLQEAIRAYQRAVKIRPGYGSAWNNMSVAHYRRKDYWQAWTCLQKAERHGHRPNAVYKRVLRKRLFPEEEPETGREPAAGNGGGPHGRNPAGSPPPGRPKSGDSKG
jgi:tetratricopeptide (TPR) repeat protein